MNNNRNFLNLSFIVHTIPLCGTVASLQFFLCLILIFLNFLLLEAICRWCRQHITELVAQPEIISDDPYQQQPISPEVLQITTEASYPSSHLTELACQSEIIPPPCPQQPTSSAELKVSPELPNPPAQEQVSAYVSHTGMQNVKQLFNNVII